MLLRRKNLPENFKVETNVENRGIETPLIIIITLNSTLIFFFFFLLVDSPPISPLSFSKKMNLSDSEPIRGKEHKRMRSESDTLKKSSSLPLAFSLPNSPRSTSPLHTSTHTSPPSSPRLHFLKEIKHESNIVKMQISRNYSSAFDAVEDHFSKSLSQEFFPPTHLSSSPSSPSSSSLNQLSSSPSSSSNISLSTSNPNPTSNLNPNPTLNPILSPSNSNILPSILSLTSLRTETSGFSLDRIIHGGGGEIDSKYREQSRIKNEIHEDEDDDDEESDPDDSDEENDPMEIQSNQQKDQNIDKNLKQEQTRDHPPQ